MTLDMPKLLACCEQHIAMQSVQWFFSDLFATGDGPCARQQLPHDHIYSTLRMACGLRMAFMGVIAALAVAGRESCGCMCCCQRRQDQNSKKLCRCWKVEATGEKGLSPDLNKHVPASGEFLQMAQRMRASQESAQAS